MALAAIVSMHCYCWRCRKRLLLGERGCEPRGGVERVHCAVLRRVEARAAQLLCLRMRPEGKEVRAEGDAPEVGGDGDERNFVVNLVNGEEGASVRAGGLGWAPGQRA